MQFSTTLAVLLSAVTAACAQQVIVSPTAGEVVTTSRAFNLTYVTQRSGVFEGGSASIDVVISDRAAASPFPGALAIQGLTPSGTTADGSSVYTTFVNPVTLDGDAAGARTISVVEYYSAGNQGLAVTSVAVTFTDSQ
ncbi:hypothetical protein B0H11DRAFT_1954637 [Mycena galericulata]|nr:hypothetical protein B0H11DRAFT_1991617 [Mycena galericulata]KAJ7511297.1 hypothetical protein B0H11DRAFT_1954637 [Mycena galericulata]